MREDLRKWFGSGKTGGVGGGGWDRYNTKGERIGKCGDAEDRGGAGEGKPKCLSTQKAAQLRAQGGKDAIANAVKRKKAEDPVTNRKGTGNPPRPVSNRITEENVPTNPGLWSRAKAEAKKRFDVYPSAYANGWAAKWYKERGGGWKTQHESTDTSADREWGTSSLTNIYKRDTPGQGDEQPLEESTGLDVIAITPQHEVVWQMWNLRPSEVTRALRLGRKKYPTATLAVQTYAGHVIRAFAPTDIIEAWEKNPNCQQCRQKLSPAELKRGDRICGACVKKNKGRVWGKDSDDDYTEQLDLLVKESPSVPSFKTFLRS